MLYWGLVEGLLWILTALPVKNPQIINLTKFNEEQDLELSSIPKMVQNAHPQGGGLYVGIETE